VTNGVALLSFYDEATTAHEIVAVDLEVSWRRQKAVFLKKARREVGAYARVNAYATVAPAPILRLGANFTPRCKLFP
jgi:hypothetical protein